MDGSGDLARDLVNEKMAKVKEALAAFKAAKRAIKNKIDDDSSPEIKNLQQEMMEVNALITVLTESLESAVDVAIEDLTGHLRSWISK